MSEGRLSEVRGIKGLGNLPRSAYRMPRLTLLQPTSRQEGGVSGEYMLGDSGQSVKWFDAAFFHIQPIRTRYPDGSELGAPECWSYDRLWPAKSVLSPFSTQCDGCVQSLWTGEDKAPCSAGYAVFGLRLPDLTPFTWRIHGEAVSVIERWAVGLELLVPRLESLWDVRVTLASEKGKSEKGKYFLPVIKHEPLPESRKLDDMVRGFEPQMLRLLEQI